MEDICGTPLAIGDLVAWPGRQSSSLWMNKGRIVRFFTYTTWYDKEKEGVIVDRVTNDKYEKRRNVSVRRADRLVKTFVQADLKEETQNE